MAGNVKGRRAEIARRHARTNAGRRVSMAALRIAELNRIWLDRYGELLPDDDAGRDDCRLAAFHLAKLSGDPAKRIHAWLSLRAPWMDEAHAAELVAEAVARPLRFRADTLAERIGLTAADRDRLKIRTIGAIDQTKDDRAALRIDRRRMYAARRRRARGAKPRAEYLAHAIKPKAWQRAGISRATWYRMSKTPRRLNA